MNQEQIEDVCKKIGVPLVAVQGGRPHATFFGTECQIADMAHEAIERQRVDAENAILRKEIVDLKAMLSESVRELHTTAVCLSDLQQREPALLNQIARCEESRRYTQEALAIADERIFNLSNTVDNLRQKLLGVVA